MTQKSPNSRRLTHCDAETTRQIWRSTALFAKSISSSSSSSIASPLTKSWLCITTAADGTKPPTQVVDDVERSYVPTIEATQPIKLLHWYRSGERRSLVIHILISVTCRCTGKTTHQGLHWLSLGLLTLDSFPNVLKHFALQKVRTQLSLHRLRACDFHLCVKIKLAIFHQMNCLKFFSTFLPRLKPALQAHLWV